MDQMFNISGENGNIQINLTSEAKKDLDDSVGSLVFPFYNNSYILTFHTKRKGWEFPAGSREDGEAPIECARRETFEETGAILKNVVALGYYIVDNGQSKHKYAIYMGDVDRFEPKPSWSETDLVKIFNEIPENISYSDDVYSIVLDYIKNIKDKRE